MTSHWWHYITYFVFNQHLSFKLFFLVDKRFTVLTSHCDACSFTMSCILWDFFFTFFKVFTVEEMLPVVAHLSGAQTKNLFLTDKKKRGRLNLCKLSMLLILHVDGVKVCYFLVT